MSRATETQVQLAARLYDARRTLRRICGESYAERLPKWRELVSRHAVASNEGAVGCALRLAVEVQKHADGEFSALWLLAAAVEIVEPDEETPL